MLTNRLLHNQEVILRKAESLHYGWQNSVKKESKPCARNSLLKSNVLSARHKHHKSTVNQEGKINEYQNPLWLKHPKVVMEVKQ